MMNRVLWSKTDATGLSVFRMCYILVLLYEITQLYAFRSILYDKVPFTEIGEINVKLIFHFWFIVTVLIFLGLFTRVATIINYIFSVIIFSSISQFGYAVFNIYVSINFLLMFLPVHRCLSLDSLMDKMKSSNASILFERKNKVLAINYLAPVLLGIAIVYLNSGFHKIVSPMWLDGLGVWLPASIPMITWTDLTWMLNMKNLMKFAGYLVLCFEVLFIFLFWFKPFRLTLLAIGVILHVGILIAFPIPSFSLTMLSIYILMIPESFWLWMRNKIKSSMPPHRVYYDANSELCVTVITLIDHFDIFNRIQILPVEDMQHDPVFNDISETTLEGNIHFVSKKNKVTKGYAACCQVLQAMGWTWILGVFLQLPVIKIVGEKIHRYISDHQVKQRRTKTSDLQVDENESMLIEGFTRLKKTKLFWSVFLAGIFFAQILLFYYSPLSKYTLRRLRSNTELHQSFSSDNFYIGLLTRYFGMQEYAIFTDWAYYNYNQVFFIELEEADGKKSPIPIFNTSGMPTNFTTGFIWNRIFAITKTAKNTEDLEKYLPYCVLWCQKKLIDTSGGKLHFYKKSIDTPQQWQPDFLRREIKKPWKKLGIYNLDSKKWLKETIF
jgi:predicted DCC family thiol-disulfide oxidoreductase YuxK